MSKPRLISFKVCPFVQRSVILLKEKNVDYDIEFIDVYDPPVWFLELSPTGKVPILQINDTVLFESAVINEYLDEVYTPSMHPSDPLMKAQNRAWIEFSSTLFMSTFKIMMATIEEEFNSAIEALNKNLVNLEKSMHKKPWFNGEEFSLIDVSIAPFFVRVKIYEKNFDLNLLKDFTELKAWSDQLLARQSVQESVVEGFEDMILTRMKQNESYLVSEV